MFARKTLAASLFLVGLVINPTYFLGCAGEPSEQEREFDYGESEDGTESLTLEGESGTSYSGSFRSADVSHEPVVVTGELEGS